MLKMCSLMALLTWLVFVALCCVMTMVTLLGVARQQCQSKCGWPDNINLRWSDNIELRWSDNINLRWSDRHRGPHVFDLRYHCEGSGDLTKCVQAIPDVCNLFLMHLICLQCVSMNHMHLAMCCYEPYAPCNVLLLHLLCCAGWECIVPRASWDCSTEQIIQACPRPPTPPTVRSIVPTRDIWQSEPTSSVDNQDDDDFDDDCDYAHQRYLTIWAHEFRC